MSESLEKYDPSKIMDVVRDRIKAEFVTMIPDEAWSEIVKGIVTKFRSPGGELDKMVWAEMSVEVTRRMATFFQTPEWGNQWGSGGPVSDQVKALLVSHLPGIIEASFGNLLQQIVQRLKQGY